MNYNGGEPDALDLLVRRGRATCSGPTQIRDVQDMSRVVTGKIDHGALGYRINYANTRERERERERERNEIELQ
ncbi:hypothetical protein C0J52_19349 [Blattella germanica]|nr:hypothetical protein C0J52_19349 [Blattella germanica]